MTEILEKEETKPETNLDTISDLFEERDLQKPERDKEPEADKETAKSSPSKEAVKSPKKDDDNEDDDTSPPELKTLKEELEKTRKTIAENQKYGRQNAQKLKSALKITKDLLESGALTQEEAESLVGSLENDGEEDSEASPYDAHPFGKILKVANAELENIRKYTDDDLLDDKVRAFDHFLSVAPNKEIEDAFEELSSLSDDPVKLTKKILSIGQRYYDASYKDIKEAGGVQEYITTKNEEIEKLKKSIDKLTKKLSQYEDFDKPRHRIDEMGESNDGSAIQDSISDLFDERDRVKRR